MFTIRVEHDKDSRDVRQCQKYKVRQENGETTILIDEHGDYTKVYQEVIRGTAVAYVMNDRAITVDVIRAKGSVHAAGRNTGSEQRK